MQWPITVVDSARLVTADNAMVRWMCKRKITDHARMSDMHRILGIKDLESILRTGRLRWYGHLERQPNDVWPNTVRQMDVDGRAFRGRPRKRWSDCVRVSRHEPTQTKARGCTGQSQMEDSDQTVWK